MTDKEKVLAVYPDAVCLVGRYGFMVYKSINSDVTLSKIAQTHRLAWSNAATRLEPHQS